MATIRSFAARYPKRFASMGQDGQDLVVSMFKLASECAKRSSDMAVSHGEVVDTGRLAAAAAAVGTAIVKVQAADDHHDDDVARGAGEGVKVQTIVLAGADPSRLLSPPKQGT
jgi:aspartokinase